MLLQLDFSIVVVSIIVLALDSLLPGVQWLKGLRVLRALKPLRSVCPYCQATLPFATCITHVLWLLLP